MISWGNTRPKRRSLEQRTGKTTKPESHSLLTACPSVQIPEGSALSCPGCTRSANPFPWILRTAQDDGGGNSQSARRFSCPRSGGPEAHRSDDQSEPLPVNFAI